MSDPTVVSAVRDNLLQQHDRLRFLIANNAETGATLLQQYNDLRQVYKLGGFGELPRLELAARAVAA